MANNPTDGLLGLINNGLNFGAGLFATSRDRIEQTVQKLVDAGKVDREHAQDFANKMVQTGEEERQAIDKMVKDQVRSQLEDLGLANSSQSKPLTAEEVRQIVKEEIAASKDGSAGK